MGRRVLALSMLAGIGLTLAGVGLIVSRPELFLSPSFGCFDCGYNEELEFMRGAVARAAVPFVFALIPVALVFHLWRRSICFKERGTASFTREQSVALLSDHPALRVLSDATTLLALIAGGLIVQLGYMSGHMFR